MSIHPRPLEYSNPLTKKDPREDKAPPHLTLVSVVPAVVFAFALCHRTSWARWLHLGRRSEPIFGALWILIASFSIYCLYVLPIYRPRWDAGVAMIVHMCFLAVTLFPGLFVIPFLLMRWV